MRSLVLITDDVAVAQRIRSAVRYAAALRLDATLDSRMSAGDELVRLEPDVILVADSCQRMNTISRLREVRRQAPAATVLLLATRGTGSSDDAFRSGVDGIVSAAAETPALGALLGQIGQGHLILSSRRTNLQFPAAEPHPLRMVSVQDGREPAQDARGTRAKA
jgi:DNA-binding NarL/FixJ family response regulator